MEQLRFLTKENIYLIRDLFGSPVYVYDEQSLRANAAAALAFPNAYGLIARYAMKANPNAAILKLFHECGMHIDASSGFECERAMRAGIPASHISLSSQETPANLQELVKQGVIFNATSLQQLEAFGSASPGGTLGLRINPGLGSGGSSKTNVGGRSASFGLWHEFIEQAKMLVEKYELTVHRIHTHIGSGSDPDVWQKVSMMSLNLLRHFPDVTTLDLGGGFKVGRMAGEPSTNLQQVGVPVKAAFEEFAEESGREIKLEIEPGTFMVANAGTLLASAQDIVSTGTAGFNFIRLDTGMTEILRPSLYGSQQPIIVVPKEDRAKTEKYVVVGHCCESGDMLTPAPDDPDTLAPRQLTIAEIGDSVAIEGAGAYCAAMSAKNYNSFPEVAEVLLQADGIPRLIRKRQSLDQLLANEI